MSAANSLRISIPVIFWDQHVERTGEEDEKNLCRVFMRGDHSIQVQGTLRQIDYLLADAEFFARGNKYHTQEIIFAARLTVAAINKAREVIA